MTSLKVAIVAATFAALAPWPGSVDSGAAVNERTLSIYNIHTKETVTATFRRGGKYDDQALAKLNRQLRDWRVDKVTEIDPELFDLLWELHTDLGSSEPIHLISGHRSLETNNMLRHSRGGQAKRSLHIAGQAADVFFPDVPLERLRNAALVRQVGGVGYYPRSGQPFVHVDTGRVRHWPRIPEAQLAQIMKGQDSITRSAPTTRVREVQIASAQVDDPVASPRAKPVGLTPPQPVRMARQPVAEPIVLASAIFPSDGYANPSAQPDEAIGSADAGALPRRSWGQSLLLPSGADGADRGLAHRELAPLRAVGSSRIVVADATPQSVKSDAPLTQAALVGYAAPIVDGRRDQIAGLLDSAAGGLRTFIEEAERMQGNVSAPVRQAVGDPIDLRPAVLSSKEDGVAGPRSQLLAPPIMTASLGSAAIEHLPFRQPGDAGIPQAATSHPVLDQGPALIGELLRAPANDQEITFAGASSIYASFGSFILSDGRSFGSRPDADSNGLVGEIFDAARQALSWVFGG